MRKACIAIVAGSMALAGCAGGTPQERRVVGQVAGGAAGAAIGSGFGSGTGRIAAVAGGAVLGAIAGGELADPGR